MKLKIRKNVDGTMNSFWRGFHYEKTWYGDIYFDLGIITIDRYREQKPAWVMYFWKWQIEIGK